MQVNAIQATSMITKYILAKLVPMMIGSPGIGKSSIVHAIAKTYNLKVIDLRLSQCDPTDLLGFPRIEGNKAGYVPMDTLPIEGDKIPEGYSGWLLFLDEMNGGTQAVQKAAYKVVLDRKVGIYDLHKNVAIVAAGNLETDNAAVEPLSTALKSRMVWMELVSDVTAWLNWAYENNIDHRITSYIKFKPGNLYTFSSDHSDYTYACNRTWEFANRVLGVVAGDSDPDMLPMLAGTISEGVAREFVGFCKIHSSLPTISQISASPETLAVPIEPSILFALTGSLGHNATDTNMKELSKFIGRLPKEFQVVTYKEIIRRNRNMLANEVVRNWVANSATAML